MYLLYDVAKSFQDNFIEGPRFNGIIPQRIKPPKSTWINFCGYKVASPLGIPACPLGTAKGISLMAQLGFDVLTYKTVRSNAAQAHPLPNICSVALNKQLQKKDYNGIVLQTDDLPINPSTIALSNSFGNASFDWPVMHEDIQQAHRHLSDGQVLIVSVFGSEQKKRSMIDDFVYTAQLAQQAGAHIIELNLSCPNIKTCKPMHQESELVFEICKKTSQNLSIPFIIKVGVFENFLQLKNALLAAARGGTRGICGINSVPMQVVDSKQNPYFGQQRIVSGISGNPIRSLAIEFIQQARSIIDQESLELELVATGGITQSEHFQLFFDAGASIAMSATGVLYNSFLGMQYHEKNIKILEKTNTDGIQK